MPDKLQLKQQLTLIIDHLAPLGDGVGYYEGKAIFVPLSAVGDKLLVEISNISHHSTHSRIIKLIKAGKERRKAPCKYYGECGGCNLQHLQEKTYQNFKHNILVNSVKYLGCDEKLITDLVSVGEQSRRRTNLKITKRNKKIILGFYSHHTHEVVDIDSCPLLQPELSSLLSPLKHCISLLPHSHLITDVALTATDSGTDILLTTSSPLPSSDCSRLLEFAEKHQICRLTEQFGPKNTINCLKGSHQATMRMGTEEVSLPHDAFTQASSRGEELLTQTITKHVREAKRVVDLYSGCGTYSLPVASMGIEVEAYEGNGEMIMALHNAALKNDQINLTAIKRDLFKRPLNSAELYGFDAAIINPPRNGAAPQSKLLATSNIPKIIIASCNPATFTRDAKYLLDNGYQLTSATPIDQFYWNHHLELIAIFEKD